MSDDTPEFGRKERVATAVEVWKKTVDVQQHFNDLELRIRNLAITVLGAVFSVAGLILKDARTSRLPALVVAGGGLICFGFYIMDAWWYHRLLMGSVLAGARVESFLSDESGVPVPLGAQISTQSHVTAPLTKIWVIKWLAKKDPMIRSKHKLNAFWAVLLVVTIGFAAGLWIAADRARDRAHKAALHPHVVAPDTVVVIQPAAVPVPVHVGSPPRPASGSGVNRSDSRRSSGKRP